jgi:hypothetical protein
MEPGEEGGKYVTSSGMMPLHLIVASSYIHPTSTELLTYPST